MTNLSKEQVAVCRIVDGISLNDKIPSKEIGFHAGILRDRIDVNVVLHFQSPCATTIACSNEISSNFAVIPEIPYYIGPIAMVPFLSPGSQQLAGAVTSALSEKNLAILRNHGQVVVGQQRDDVIANAVFFELACKIILAAGNQVQCIAEEEYAKLYQQGQADRRKIAAINIK